jgi:hypothetical protein
VKTRELSPDRTARSSLVLGVISVLAIGLAIPLGRVNSHVSLVGPIFCFAFITWILTAIYGSVLAISALRRLHSAVTADRARRQVIGSLLIVPIHIIVASVLIYLWFTTG